MNQTGFSLIELVCSLFLFLLLLSFYPLVIQVSPSVSSTKNSTFLETTLFMNQLSMEVREAISIDIIGNTLILGKRNGITVTYEKYGNFLRRRVNGAGHELVLTKIKTVSFTSVPNGVVITIQDEFGNEYQKKLTHSLLSTNFITLGYVNET